MSEASQAPLAPLWVTLAAAAGLPLDRGYQWLPLPKLLQQHHPIVEVTLPLLISGHATAETYAQLGQTLANAYGPDHPITLAQTTATGEIAAAAVTGPLQTLTTMASTFGAAVSLALIVPPLAEGSSFSALQAIVAQLRAPEGCPWDRAQTLQSMRHDLLGECAEVLEAIDLDSATFDNGPHIAEELGDLFMAGVLMVQIAVDRGRFQMAAAMQSIVTKLIRRHPHVFADTVVDGIPNVLANWDAIKAQEKAAKGQVTTHPLDGVPAVLPALERARMLQSKAAKAALLDRTTLAATVSLTLAGRPLDRQTLDESTLGAALWAIVALADQAEINAEDALRSYGVHFAAQDWPKQQNSEGSLKR